MPSNHFCENISDFKVLCFLRMRAVVALSCYLKSSWNRCKALRTLALSRLCLREIAIFKHFFSNTCYLKHLTTLYLFICSFFLLINLPTTSISLFLLITPTHLLITTLIHHLLISPYFLTSSCLIIDTCLLNLLNNSVNRGWRFCWRMERKVRLRRWWRRKRQARV